MEENALPLGAGLGEGKSGNGEDKKRGIGTNRLWYAALVPLFGIYNEMFADSFGLGLLVWGMAIVLGPAACLLDYKFVGKKGIYSPSLKPIYALLPPLYIFKRTKLTEDPPICGIVWFVLAFFAIIANGFTGAMMMDEADMTNAIINNTWSVISETRDVSSEQTIGESLEEIAGCGLEWSGVRADGFLSVTCKGENGFSASFKIEHDGFIAGKFHLVSITLNGSTYDGEDAAKLIHDHYPKEENESSAAEESAPGE